ncbi:hypothetical protein DM02DRAFT_647712 [Periconia macrospinosa]|uniref:Uncharacterized protein n=1 Tax=Periconia macrospinosa TaxID=97972 RepID=A0A2V1EF48_9PLEO|nr:hypothetical protein DM02DRAFT_647712 [Periconia macrospinosa]
MVTFEAVPVESSQAAAQLEPEPEPEPAEPDGHTPELLPHGRYTPNRFVDHSVCIWRSVSGAILPHIHGLIRNVFKSRTAEAASRSRKRQAALDFIWSLEMLQRVDENSASCRAENAPRYTILSIHVFQILSSTSCYSPTSSLRIAAGTSTHSPIMMLLFRDAQSARVNIKTVRILDPITS